MQKQIVKKNRFELRPIGFWDFENPFRSATQSIASTTTIEALQQDVAQIGQDIYHAIEKHEQKEQGHANGPQ